MAKRGDIILVKVFFSDSPESKTRPCVVLSDEKYGQSGFLLVSPITSSSDEFCLPIAKNDADCVLYEGSSARFDGVIKVSEKQVLRKLGRISTGFCARLVEKIISLLK